MAQMVTSRGNLATLIILFKLTVHILKTFGDMFYCRTVIWLVSCIPDSVVFNTVSSTENCLVLSMQVGEQYPDFQSYQFKVLYSKT